MFDTSFYLEKYPDVAAADVNPLDHFIKYPTYRPHPLFDPMSYLADGDIPDGDSALLHFLTVGGFSGRNPTAYFDTTYYLSTYRDARESGLNPLVHYVTEGFRDLRAVHPILFRDELYLRSNTVPEGTPPLSHFMRTIDAMPNPALSPYTILHSAAEMEALALEPARLWETRPVIHPRDMTMAHALFRPNNHGRPQRAVAKYFEDGDDSAGKLASIVYDGLGLDRERTFDFLEFASGYGRVSRHWRRHINANVTACDIHEEAVDFLKTHLGVEALQSVTDPRHFSPPRSYDAIFCLSFFTHMPPRTWKRWLRKLFDALNPGGVLIFTTHGVTAAGIKKITIGDDGIHFFDETEQYDLDTADYGYTAVTNDYVKQAVAEIEGASIDYYRKDAFWNMQDVFAVRKN